EQRDARIAAQDVFEAPDAGRIAQIRGDGLHHRESFRFEIRRERFEALAAARDENEVVAATRSALLGGSGTITKKPACGSRGATSTKEVIGGMHWVSEKIGERGHWGGVGA